MSWNGFWGLEKLAIDINSSNNPSGNSLSGLIDNELLFLALVLLIREITWIIFFWYSPVTFIILVRNNIYSESVVNLLYWWLEETDGYTSINWVPFNQIFFFIWHCFFCLFTLSFIWAMRDSNSVLDNNFLFLIISLSTKLLVFSHSISHCMTFSLFLIVFTALWLRSSTVIHKLE